MTRAGIAVLFLAIAPCAAAEPRWTMLRSSTMTVIGDQPPAALRDVAVQIEQFRTVVGSLIPNAGRPPSLPTVVFVFGTRKAMEPFVPMANGRPAEVAGYFQRSPDANHIVLALENFDEGSSVVYHEYTHLLVVNAVRSMPVWLNEGLAEFYSSYTLSRDGRSAEIGRILDWRLAMLRDRWLPLAEVLAVDSAGALHGATQRRSIFYSEAWALTHYLLSQVPEGGDKINKYVAAIADGRAPESAFFEAFGATIAEFDRQLRTYIRQHQFAATRYTFKERIAVDPPGPPTVLSTAEADAWLGDLQRRINRDDEAARRIESAIASAPDSAAAQLSFGLLRLADGHTAEAVEALERARSLAPDDFITQFLHGVALLKSDDGSHAYAPAAAASLGRAVRLRDDSSDAHAWLAYAQMMSDETLPAARASILRAIALAPGRLDYRLRAADIDILQGHLDAAQALLTAIAAVTFDASAAAAAKARLDAIEEARSAAQRDRSRPARSIEVGALDGAGTSSPTGVRFRFRETKAGEERVYGSLTGVDCRAGAVRFNVDAGGTAVSATVQRMEDVELISYLDTKDFMLTCGPRTPPDHVYLTFRREPPSATKIVVAVEFLPSTYTP